MSSPLATTEPETVKLLVSSKAQGDIRQAQIHTVRGYRGVPKSIEGTINRTYRVVAVLDLEVISLVGDIQAADNYNRIAINTLGVRNRFALGAYNGAGVEDRVASSRNALGVPVVRVIEVAALERCKWPWFPPFG